jgi:hypothetical protein
VSVTTNSNDRVHPAKAGKNHHQGAIMAKKKGTKKKATPNNALLGNRELTFIAIVKSESADEVHHSRRVLRPLPC